MKIDTLPIFEGVTKAELQGLLDETREVSFQAGTALFRRAKPGGEVMFLVQGRVKVHVGEMELAVLNAPCVVGELELLTGGKPAADVTALDDTRGHAMGSDAFRKRLRATDSCAVRILENIARQLALRLAAMDDRVIQILSGKAAAELKDMAAFRAKLFGEWST